MQKQIRYFFINLCIVKSISANFVLKRYHREFWKENIYI